MVLYSSVEVVRAYFGHTFCAPNFSPADFKESTNSFYNASNRLGSRTLRSPKHGCAREPMNRGPLESHLLEEFVSPL
jgi:hypothetical protein